MTACSRSKVQVPEAPHSTAIMQPPKVLLALPGDLVSPTETLTHYATKLGGHPVFPGSAAPLEAMQRLTKCGVCSSPLSLVLQAYAPLSLPAACSVPERVLHLWGCTQQGCANKAGSWRVTRSQMRPPPHAAPAEVQLQHAGSSAVCEASLCETNSRTHLDTDASIASGRTQQPNPAITDKQTHSTTTTAAGLNAADKSAAPFVCSSDAEDAGFGTDGFADSLAFGVDGFGGGGFADFGAGLPCSAGASSADAFNMDDLSSALDSAAAAITTSCHPKTTSSSAKSKAQKATHAGHGAESQHAYLSTPSCCLRPDTAVFGALLPEFHLYAEEEPEGDHGARARADELAHVQALLHAYQAQEAGASGSSRPDASTQKAGSTSHSATAASGSGQGQSRLAGQSSQARKAKAGNKTAAAAAGGGGGGGDGTDDEDSGTEGTADTRLSSEHESWGGEEYEADAVRGVVGAYLRFSKRLAARPEQCVRYQPGGLPMWPTDRLPTPGCCTRCGAPRMFELQLMAPVIAAALECADWIEPHHLPQYKSGINAAGNWDLVTVAAFTCSASCGSAAGVSSGSAEVHLTICEVVEEMVVVVCEHECHVK